MPHTLRSELKQLGALPIDRVFEIAYALASALARLHGHGLVHRDVKPSNVIFVGGVVKLADIGLASQKLLASAADWTVIDSGSLTFTARNRKRERGSCKQVQNLFE